MTPTMGPAGGPSESDQENNGNVLMTMALNDFIERVKANLTSPEKKLSVEEWLRHNAKLGEERLRRECDRMVCIFEREGNRALQSLEGIMTID